MSSTTRDETELSIKQMLTSLPTVVGSPHAAEMLWETVWLIDDRHIMQGHSTAGGRVDAVWETIREVLTTLTKDSSLPARVPHSTLAIDLVEALIAVRYVERAQRSIRLVKYVTILLRCGHLKIARAAAGTLKKLYRVDRSPEMKDQLLQETKHSLETIRKELSQRNLQARGTGLVIGGIMLCDTILAATPKTLSPVRQEVVQVMLLCCGVHFYEVRNSALQCFQTLLQTQGFISSSEIRKIVEDAVRTVSSPHPPDGVVAYIGVMNLLLAPAFSKVDLSVYVGQYCQSVLRLYKNTRNQFIKHAIVAAMPRMAMHDAERLSIYSAGLIEPLKDLKGDVSEKAGQLSRVAELIRLSRYTALGDANQRNIQSIVVSLVTNRSAAWPTVVEEGWEVIAAIVKAGDKDFYPSVLKCAESLPRVRLSSSLVETVSTIRNLVPTLDQPLAQQLGKLVQTVLQIASRCEDSGSGGGGGNGGGGPTTSPPRERKQGIFGKMFWGGGSDKEVASEPVADEDATVAALEYQRKYPRMVCSLNSPISTASSLVSSSGSSLNLSPTAPSEDGSDISHIAEEMRVNNVPLLRHSSAAVRRASAVTIVESLVKSVESVTLASQHPKETTNQSRQLLLDLVESYLKMVLLEQDPMLRLEQLKRLDDKRLYGMLGDNRCIPHIYAILHDSVRLREVVLSILCGIGRTEGNSSIIQELINIVHSIVLTLEHTTNPVLVASHLSDLACFTAAGPDAFAVDLRRIIRVIQSHLDTTGSSIVVPSAALMALTKVVELFKTSESAVQSAMVELSALAPRLLAVVCDATVVMGLRHKAMVTLQVLFSVSAFDPTPAEYSDWVEALTQLYIGATSSEGAIRADVMHCFGLLGAIDPQSLRRLAVGPEGHRTNDAVVALGDEPVVTNDYTNVAYHALVTLLNEPLVEGIAVLALRTLVKVVQGASVESAPGLRAARVIIMLMGRIDTILLRQECLSALAALVTERRNSVVQVLLGEVVGVLEASWNYTDSLTAAASSSTLEGKNSLLSSLIDLVEALAPGELSIQVQEEQWPWLYAKLVDVVTAQAHQDEALVLRIVDLFKGKVGEELPPHGVLLVLPCLNHLIADSQDTAELRCRAIVAAIDIICRQELTRFLFPLLQSLRNVARHITTDVQLAATLQAIANDALGDLIRNFPSARQTVQSIQVECSKLSDEAELEDVFESAASKAAFEEAVSSHRISEKNSGPIRTGSLQTDGFALEQILRHLNKAQAGAKSAAVLDWSRWFDELESLLISSSPHKAFRDCTLLCERYERFRSELFPAAFLCTHTHLGSSDRALAEGALLNALAQKDQTAFASNCLALADYVDHGANFAFDSSSDQVSSSLPSGQFSSHTHPQHRLPPLGSYQQTRSALRVMTLGQSHDGMMTEGSFNGFQASSPQTFAEAARWIQLRRPMSSSDIETSHEIDSNNSSPKTSSPALPSPKLLMFTVDQLADMAAKNLLYSKAIRYQEVNVRLSGLKNVESQPAVEMLARLYSAAGEHWSVEGLLNMAGDYSKPESHATQSELRRRWPDANAAYRSMIDMDCLTEAPLGALEGHSRTLNLTAKWSEVVTTAQQIARRLGLSGPGSADEVASTSPTTPSADESPENSPSTFEEDSAFPQRTSPKKVREKIAPHACLAAWALANWDEMQRYVFWMNNDSPNLYLFTAVLLFKKGTKEELLQCTHQARLQLESTFKTLLPISYNEAYDCVTKLQHYQELEEALEYNTTASTERKSLLLRSWRRRFFALKPDELYPMLFSLGIRTLVVRPLEMADSWLHFAKSTLATHRQLAQWAANTVREAALASSLSEGSSPLSPASSSHSLGTTPTSAINFSSSVGAMAGARPALDTMMKVVSCLPRDFQLDFLQYEWEEGTTPKSDVVAALSDAAKTILDSPLGKERVIHGMMRLQLGMWKAQINPQNYWLEPLRDELLDDFLTAVEALPTNPKAWHQWGLLNYRVQQRSEGMPLSERQRFMRAASNAFVAAVCRTTTITEALQDILRLLQLWIRYQGAECLQERMEDSISRISVDYWAFVVPQLIGYLGDDSSVVLQAMKSILTAVCRSHPQAVVFPLLVPQFNDQASPRSQIASNILTEECPSRLFREAENVANCLIDAAATPLENLREEIGLILRALNSGTDPLRSDLTAVQTTVHKYARVLEKDIPNISNVVALIESAFGRDDTETVHKAAREVYDDATDALKHITTIYFSRGLVRLQTTKDLCVCIPGEYQPGTKDVAPTIAAFVETLNVIPSKHRPRRLKLQGSDGRVYSFLLKANEDVRIDERVMQLFMLVNSQFINNRQLAAITRFPVVPLSSRVGLLGWVENTETLLHRIVRHRRHMEIPEKLELQRIQSEVEDISLLPTAQRVDVFMHARGDQPQDDLAAQLWLQADNAERWFDRRKTYTQSLAVMSMTGYVLGLGDRHLGNLLMKISTGQIVHVDFGDCFDVARDRALYPETVPFRLTPMMASSMEVMGASGLFKYTAISAMHLLRSNSDAIIALLSAFIHDPIVSLRLTHRQQQQHAIDFLPTNHSLTESIAATLGASPLTAGGPEQLVERLRAKLHGLEFVSLNEVGKQRLPMRPDTQYSIATAAGGRSKKLPVAVEAQVEALIDQSLSPDNLSSLYPGWVPWW